MSAGKRFFDTNVLLYLHDDRDPRKQQLAQQVFGKCLDEGTLVLSTQVVQEFYVAASRKLKLPRALVHALTLDYLCLPVIHIEPRHIRRALENEAAYRVSFWDALILAGAEEAKAEVLFTEDLNHGQQYGAVRAENPFLEPSRGEGQLSRDAQ